MREQEEKARQQTQSRGEVLGAGTHSPTAMGTPAVAHKWVIQPANLTLPLVASNEYGIIKDSDGERILVALGCNPWPVMQAILQRVNVHDDLLAALNAITAYVDTSPDVYVDPMLAHVVALARAALARAEGRQP